ncbi:MAG: ABC transporter ATP-binding protein [Carnobacterium sp.]|uniref:amino acid ABC transporter ATP-binding/permease protein n=1 Tax=Carnobacterium sp. TaxID=48221 RepID=UPI002FCA8768
MKQLKVIRWLVSFVRPLKGRMLLAIIFGIISNLSVIAISLIGIQEIIAIFMNQPNDSQQALLIMVSCGLTRGAARYVEQYLNHDIAFRLLALIRENIFAVLRKLGSARLTEKKSGDLVTAITTDVEALEVFFAHTISPIFIAVGTSIASVVFLSRHHWGLALILLLGHLVVGVIIPLISFLKHQKIGEDYQTAFVALNQQVIENVNSLSDVFQFQLKEQRVQKLNAMGEALNQQHRKQLQQSSLLQIASEIVLVATAVSILLVGNFLHLPAATVLTATVLSLSSFGSVLALNGLGSALLTTFASGQRLYALTQEQPTVSFETSEEKLAEFDEGQMNQVTFNYPARSQSILNAASLLLNRGEWIGIGGESGSGKSTLVKLLMRYWDPASGTIEFDGIPLSSIQEQALHHLEGVMEQSTFLFEETIFNNIRLGRMDASKETVEKAARQASLHDWILTLPEGYETKIGGQARSISDGERQRIGLARLLLQDAPLLLLDEPTSNLDYINEQAILNVLSSEIKEKAVLLVSHRETTLAYANQQLRLEGGMLKEDTCSFKK